MMLELTERQRATVAAALTTLAAFVLLVAVASILWAIGTFVARFSNVFLPLGVAAVLALVVRPYYVWLAARMPRALALILVFLSFLIPIGGFLWFFGALVADQAAGLFKSAPELWERFLVWLEEHWPWGAEVLRGREIGTRLRSAVEGQQDRLVAGLQTGFDVVLVIVRRVGSMIGVILSWAVLPVYFAFFLMSDPRGMLRPDSLLPFLKKHTRDNVIYLVNEFVEILVAFFRGQLIVAFLQGCLFAVGFSVVGLRYGLVLGLVLGFLNIIPYLGSIVGLGVAIPLGFFQEGGGGLLVVAVLVVFTVVQMIEGYVLTPKIMGDRTGLHPMAIIVAVFFWGSALNGIAGMILAIPLTAFLVVFWRLAKERYIGEVV
jgi:predicted PurR-regulated permease PerM